MSVENFLAALAGSGGLNPGWRSRAACRGMSAELLFPERGDSATLATAREVCASCPVSDACAEVGMGQRFGVWGGLSERERRLVRSRHASWPVASAVAATAVAVGRVGRG